VDLLPKDSADTRLSVTLADPTNEGRFWLLDCVLHFVLCFEVWLMSPITVRLMESSASSYNPMQPLAHNKFVMISRTTIDKMPLCFSTESVATVVQSLAKSVSVTLKKILSTDHISHFWR